jgi:hypothetical protein
MALLEGLRGVPRNETVATVARRPARRVTEAKVLEEVVAELKEIDRRTGIERTLAIGELILSQFFGGDPAVWRDRRRNKNNSIRRLAEREDCPFCRSALNEAVGVYVAVVGLPCVRTFGHISASHVASVLRLPQTERQEVLQEAERGQWSVRELRQRVVVRRRADGERRGRPARRNDLRSLAILRQRLNQIDEAIAEIESADALSGDLRAALGRLVGELERHRTRVLALAGGPCETAPDAVASEIDFQRRKRL